MHQQVPHPSASAILCCGWSVPSHPHVQSPHAAVAAAAAAGAAAGLSLIALDQSRNKRIEPTYKNILLVM